MYKGAPYINRQIKRRDQERLLEQHRFNLTNIKGFSGSIDTSEGVIINNRKKELQKEARFTEIQRQNRILLEKISSIMSKTSKNKTFYPKINKSLNSAIRKQQNQNIQIENAKLLRRLQERKPNYETEKLKHQWKKQKDVMKNLSVFPYVLGSKKMKRNSVQRNHYSPEKNVEHCRVRVIDGITFLITVKLDSESMKIIGDNKYQKQIKVIEIERNEAIDFIEQECQGKIQNIFNQLKYDRNEEALYLVAKDVDFHEFQQEYEKQKKKQTKKQEKNEVLEQRQEKEEEFQQNQKKEQIKEDVRKKDEKQPKKEEKQQKKQEMIKEQPKQVKQEQKEIDVNKKQEEKKIQ